MDKAVSFLQEQFKYGLCYPVWIADDGEMMMSKVARQESSKAIGPTSTNSSFGLDNSLLSTRQPLNKRDDSENMESRDAWTEAPAQGSARESNEKVEHEDLDDVIAKIVRKRDDLMQEKAQADEEIKRLRLENQNLKNLNSISRRITTAQRDEITKLKLNAANDHVKIEELEKSLQILRLRTIDAKNALDEHPFLGGIGDCQ